MVSFLARTQKKTKQPPSPKTHHLINSITARDCDKRKIALNSNFKNCSEIGNAAWHAIATQKKSDKNDHLITIIAPVANSNPNAIPMPKSPLYQCARNINWPMDPAEVIYFFSLSLSLFLFLSSFPFLIVTRRISPSTLTNALQQQRLRAGRKGRRARENNNAGFSRSRSNVNIVFHRVQDVNPRHYDISFPSSYKVFRVNFECQYRVFQVTFERKHCYLPCVNC